MTAPPASTIRFTSFPPTTPPPELSLKLVEVFKHHELAVGTEHNAKGLESDVVLARLAPDLRELGFEVEASKKRPDRLARPVFFGEGGLPTLRYEIDAYAPVQRCGLEVEAGRALMGNAIFRDLFQAMVMVDLDHLCMAVPNAYRFKSSGRQVVSRDYAKTIAVATALYGHSRLVMPYGLTVIGY